jgi:crotonobetainyl-CoA:carnitine CoA-transferase CaiB-like acyl-CoA transferase
MSAPLDGVRVIEVANWLAAPAATALMADLGADVIKVEPPGGDVFHGFPIRSLGYNYDFPLNPAYELDNRGKRSITVDLEKPGGPELVRKLAADCDVFLTNLVQRRRARYGLAYEDLRAANSRLVYVSFSGYGTRGPDQDRPGFDYAAFWARSGIMGMLGEPDAPPPLCRGGQGDHATALNLLAGTLAALLQRERTGQGQHMETTLQATGMWTIAGDYSAALMSGMAPPRISREAPTHPIWNSYRCADGRWVLMVHATPFPNYWPAFCRAIEKPEWAGDERWNTLPTLMAHSRELTAQIDQVIGSQPLAHWAARFDAEGLIWSPVTTMTEGIADAQAREMGWFTTIEHPEAGEFETLDTPFKLYGTDTGVRGPAPAAGQHTFDVLAEFGIEGEALDRLATAGVLG